MTGWRVTEIRDGVPVGEAIDVEPGDLDHPGPAGLSSARILSSATTHRGRLRVEVVVDGWRFEFEGEDAERAILRARATSEGSSRAALGGELEIRAIIPGRVASVAVIEGDAVTAGQPLLVVEAMKMQNELRAPRAGSVRAVSAHAGQTIEMGDLLVTLE